MEGRFIGYVRTLPSDQEHHLQMDALQLAGCQPHHIFSDKPGGVKSERPGFEQCLQELRQGDTLVVWRLDGPGKSVHHLIQLFEKLQKMGIGFRSICDEAIDTTKDWGMVVFNIFSSLSMVERRLLQENTKAGLREARAIGRKGGRKPTVNDDLKVQLVKKMSQNTSISVSEICETLKISRATYYRYLSIAE
ncbi:recombinase family protein [Chlorobium sp. BLA1]|uniref:recombinase family protein n=1 Tax=Candidatus Chlorobium masyuteum TaxID=2716876 RepID=UPI001420F184|nr:recombinase family protein [Candidatus Chlorobium masyuteum]NHQ60098.1 recombinase family protein [Candidatus Chlorobium masyuteum]NTU44629.1 recombinase family protein [Chlorobiaceae bacterium]